MTNLPPKLRKAALRKDLMGSIPMAESHSARIRRDIRAWLDTEPRLRNIATFYPLPDEPDLMALCHELPERKWHFPRVHGEDMRFHAIHSLQNDFQTGRFGIREPLDTLPSTEPETIDLFLCPGLAFDLRALTRLGRGKGYYDRYLARARNDTIFAGVTFPERIVEHTFPEDHDIHMHRIFC